MQAKGAATFNSSVQQIPGHPHAAVRRLVGDIVAEGVEATVSKATRQTVEAISELLADYDGGVPLAALCKHLKLDKSSTSRRVASAIERGFLKNEEDRKGRPARLKLADPLPHKVQVLPDVQEVLHRCTVDRGDRAEKVFPLRIKYRIRIRGEKKPSGSSPTLQVQHRNAQAATEANE